MNLAEYIQRYVNRVTPEELADAITAYISQEKTT
jgi:hypothetical protein